MQTNPAIIICVGLLASAAHAATDNFDDAKPGPLPTTWDRKWTGTQTGDGAAKWSIEKDDTAPSKPHVLAQRGEAKYPVALKNDSALKDGFVEVKFKPVAGNEDQAGGVVWRAKDANNYYIARANALEDNVTIYHTIGGQRVAFKSSAAKVASGVWHTLRVDFKGGNFIVTFNGLKVIEVSDDSFKDAGKVGIWTKADSVTLFDDFNCGGTQ